MWSSRAITDRSNNHTGSKEEYVRSVTKEEHTWILLFEKSSSTSDLSLSFRPAWCRPIPNWSVCHKLLSVTCERIMSRELSAMLRNCLGFSSDAASCNIEYSQWANIQDNGHLHLIYLLSDRKPKQHSTWMRSRAVSLVCRRDDTKMRTGLSGEWVHMAAYAGLFMLFILGQYKFPGYPCSWNKKGIWIYDANCKAFSELWYIRIFNSKKNIWLSTK